MEMDMWADANREELVIMNDNYISNFIIYMSKVIRIDIKWGRQLGGNIEWNQEGKKTFSLGQDSQTGIFKMCWNSSAMNS